MKTISIKQPWAWLIIHGGKDIENRDWYTRIRGRVAIHAGKYRPSDSELRNIEKAFRVSIPRDRLQFGGIIGTVEIVNCVTDHPSRWFFGTFGFVLARPRPVRFLPCTGKLGFFKAPQDLD